MRLTLAIVLESPRWVVPVPNLITEILFPIGRLQYLKRNGDRVNLVVVLVRTESEVLLKAYRPDTDVVEEGIALTRSDSVGGGEWREAMKQLHPLAMACHTRGPVTIGYRKAPDAQLEERHLKEVVPNATGESVIAHDIDRQAARRFRIDRIEWVKLEAAQ